jgi:hypothetical protein
MYLKKKVLIGLNHFLFLLVFFCVDLGNATWQCFGEEGEA